MKKCTEMIENFLKESFKNDNLNDDDSSRKFSKTSQKEKINRSSIYDNLKENYQPGLMRSDSSGENFKRLHKPIIYVSMGTVFNNENSEIFEIIVEACKYFSDNYSIIISTGDEKLTTKLYEKYTDMSQNILFVPNTPQIEILKRAHLFISHAGMNSVSEALNYGLYK